MLSLRSSAALVGMAAVVGACAATARPPSGPNVWVLPKEGKDLARFRQEDEACRQHARGQIDHASPQQAGAAAAPSTGTLQWRYDLAYAQCMTASGNRTPLTEPGLVAGGAPYLAQPYYGSLRRYHYDPALGGWRRRHHLGHRYHW
jgi:hypothetical protein